MKHQPSAYDRIGARIDQLSRREVALICIAISLAFWVSVIKACCGV